MFTNEELTWFQFKNLNSIRKLPLNEQVQYYNRYLNNLSTQRALAQIGIAAGGGTSSTTPLLPSNCIEFVVNTYFGFTYYFDMVSSGPTDYTINWGDGNIETGNIDGTVSLNHNYADNGSYTVQLCFSDVSLITELDFIGDD